MDSRHLERGWIFLSLIAIFFTLAYGSAEIDSGIYSKEWRQQHENSFQSNEDKNMYTVTVVEEEEGDQSEDPYMFYSPDIRFVDDVQAFEEQMEEDASEISNLQESIQTNQEVFGDNNAEIESNGPIIELIEEVPSENHVSSDPRFLPSPLLHTHYTDDHLQHSKPVSWTEWLLGSHKLVDNSVHTCSGSTCGNSASAYEKPGNSLSITQTKPVDMNSMVNPVITIHKPSASSIGNWFGNILPGLGGHNPSVPTFMKPTNGLLGGHVPSTPTFTKPTSGFLGGLIPSLPTLIKPTSGLLGGHVPSAPTLTKPTSGLLGGLIPSFPTFIKPTSGLLGGHVPSAPTLTKPTSGLLGGLIPSFPTFIKPTSGLLGGHVPSAPTFTKPTSGLLGGWIPSLPTFMKPTSGLLGGHVPSAPTFTKPTSGLLGGLIPSVPGFTKPNSGLLGGPGASTNNRNGVTRSKLLVVQVPNFRQSISNGFNNIASNVQNTRDRLDSMKGYFQDMIAPYYRVAYSTDVPDPWHNKPTDVLQASGPSGSFQGDKPYGSFQGGKPYGSFQGGAYTGLNYLKPMDIFQNLVKPIQSSAHDQSRPKKGKRRQKKRKCVGCNQ